MEKKIFGNEERGLSEEILKECDFVSFIPSNASYPVLNLSHAVAIFLYEIFSRNKNSKLLYKPAERKRLKVLEGKFEELARRTPGVKNPEKVALAFKRLLRRSRPSAEELQALFAVF